MATTQPVVARSSRRLIATVGALMLTLGLAFAALPAGASETPPDEPVPAAADAPADEPGDGDAVPAPPADTPPAVPEPAVPEPTSPEPAPLEPTSPEPPAPSAPTAASDPPPVEHVSVNAPPPPTEGEGDAGGESQALGTQTFLPAFHLHGEAVCNPQTYEYEVDWSVTSFRLLLLVTSAEVDGDPLTVSPALLPLFHSGHASSTAPGDATSTTLEVTGAFAIFFSQTHDLTLPLAGDCVPPKGSVTVDKVVNGVPAGTDTTEFAISVGDDERGVVSGTPETWDDLELGAYPISESGASDYVTSITPEEVTLTEQEPDANVTVTNTPKLGLTSMCTDTVTDEHWMRVRNEHPFDVPYTWDMPSTSNEGNGTAPPGDSFFEVPALQPGTTRISVGDVLVNTKAQNTNPCEGEVAITKQVEGPGPDGAGYTVDVLDAGDQVVASVTLGAGDSEVVTLPGTLAPGGYTYHFAESVDHGASSTVLDPEQVAITDGTEATVVVTNTFEPASITVVKQTGLGGGEEFTFTFDGGDLFVLTDGGEQVFGNLSPGSYEILETALPEDWQLDGVDCGDASTDPTEGGVVVNLNAGEDVACVFTNVEVSPVEPVTPDEPDEPTEPSAAPAVEVGAESAGADATRSGSSDGGAEVRGTQTGSLPFTGAGIAGLAVLAGALLAGGLALWLGARRRRAIS